MKEKNMKIFKLVRNIIIVFMALATVLGILKIAPNYKNEDITNTTNLIINNKNITSHLKNSVLIKEDVIYLSKQDIYNFFDPYIYYNKDEQRVITSYGTKVASLIINKTSETINGKEYTLSAPAIIENNIIYLPFSLMNDVYNADISYIKNTNTVNVETLSKEKITATANSNLSIKSRTTILSRTVDKAQKSDTLVVISTDKGWTKVRTSNGKIGYIPENKLSNKTTIRTETNTDLKLDGKINMVWDYYSEYVTAPNRTGTTIPGVNVVSPSFFSLAKLGEGDLLDKVGDAGLQYIQWAKSNNYQIWGLVSNESMIQTTSDIMNSYALRSKLIDNIVSAAKKYNLNGVNIDFEYMYDKDIDLFTQFLVELHPRLKELGIILSVDVTAPDGGENWSSCYDRNAIADNCDYIIFMAYDQYGSSSTKSGTTAGYDWVKVNLNKFLKTEEINPSKIILGVPFFTRLWEESTGSSTSSTVVDMKSIANVLPSGIEKKWLDDVRQYYVEYIKNGKTYKMWIEDEKSIKEKLSLISENSLAGAAFWAKGREDNSIWPIISDSLGLNK